MLDKYETIQGACYSRFHCIKMNFSYRKIAYSVPASRHYLEIWKDV